MGSFGGYYSGFAALSHSAAKAAGARLRSLGLLQEKVNWQARAITCESCPMRVIHRGVTYCGKPFLSQIDRNEALEGCGCPTVAKSKRPDEHCPVDSRYQPAEQIGVACTCKWCMLSASAS